MSHEVKLPAFSGPIDLLLHLITRRRVDIYEIPLATITDEYLRAMAGLQRLDLESTTGFLVVAATLLELKSARLLPARGDDDDGNLLEERDFLLARLMECATYRAAGAWFRIQLARGERFFARDAALEPQFVGVAPDLLAGVDLADLVATAEAALAPKPQLELDVSHVAPIRVSVRDAIADLAHRLEDGERRSFSELCGPNPRRIDVVVRFLALLELFKAGAIELDQVDRRDEIVVCWTGDAAVADVVETADEYSVGEAAGRSG